MTLFSTTIERKYTKAEGDGAGGFIDVIEGWRL
jgi:hypothetical protein